MKQMLIHQITSLWKKLVLSYLRLPSICMFKTTMHLHVLMLHFSYSKQYEDIKKKGLHNELRSLI